jgi:hypothetical protein
MEWPELKYSSGVTWTSTCQLDSNICPLKRKRLRGPPRATHRPSFRKRQEIELFLPEKLKNAIKINKQSNSTQRTQK